MNVSGKQVTVVLGFVFLGGLLGGLLNLSLGVPTWLSGGSLAAVGYLVVTKMK